MSSAAPAKLMRSFMKTSSLSSCLLCAALLAVPSLSAAQAGHVHETPAPAAPAHAAAGQSSRERPAVRAVLATAAPKIDGVLDEAVWQTANTIDTFVQQEP